MSFCFALPVYCFFCVCYYDYGLDLVASISLLLTSDHLFYFFVIFSCFFVLFGCFILATWALNWASSVSSQISWFICVSATLFILLFVVFVLCPWGLFSKIGSLLCCTFLGSLPGCWFGVSYILRKWEVLNEAKQFIVLGSCVFLVLVIVAYIIYNIFF